ncbi:MAG TPA: polysaccharide deacetylase family protein [Candidatus Saccharimonadales bacterium]|nr:polysaccharide deacetylase family protein [Candidatus Saccharimonadales bacterium]
MAVTESARRKRWHRDDWASTFGVEKETKLEENWPAGTRVAVVLSFDTQGDVDAAIPGTTGTWKNGAVNFADLTQRQYDIRCGVPRILELLAEHGVKATFPICGITAEWYPETVREIQAAGHEVAVHGHWHLLFNTLAPEEQRRDIEDGTKAVADALGEQPKGFVSPVFSTTSDSFDKMLELGYLWNSDFDNDDLPYLLEKNGKTIVQLPVGLNDWDLWLMQDALGARMGGVPYASPSNVTDVLTSQFDQLYKESAREPRIFHYTLHPKITGRPYRAWSLGKFIEHAKSHDGVWFCTASDVAKLCV